MDREQRVWDILEKSSIGMLTTCFGGGLRARPLDARPDREAGVIFFITDVVTGEKPRLGENRKVAIEL